MRTLAIDDKAPALLARNRAFCAAAARAALDAADAGMTEHAVTWANVAGECCSNMHPGYYMQPQLEKMLQKIGARLEAATTSPPLTFPLRRRNARTWLHILTMALPIGGHTRLVERIIANTAVAGNDQHSILLINQENSEVPSWLIQAARNTGGDLVFLPDGLTFIERAQRVKQFARQWADIVMLHIHPNDPVASVAFAEAGGPPVIFLNHADHVFWLGAGCPDIIADIRPEGQQLTLERRGGLTTSIVPIPLEPFGGGGMGSAEARQLLGIAPDAVVLLAIAASYKFVPYGTLDFPAMAAEIVRRHDNALLLVIGPTDAEPCWRKALEASAGRLRLLGIQRDIDQYYAAADICLESFPVGSLTSTLDAMLRGIPVVRAPRGTPSILVLSGYDGLAEPADGPEAYQQQVSRLITAPEARAAAGEAQRRAVLQTHTGEGWLYSWRCLVSKLPAVHAPHAPDLAELPEAADSLDYIWAEMQERQHTTGKKTKPLFKMRIRAAFKDFRRGELFQMWLSAVRGGNWKVAMVLFRYIFKPPHKSLKQR